MTRKKTFQKSKEYFDFIDKKKDLIEVLTVKTKKQTIKIEYIVKKAGKTNE